VGSHSHTAAVAMHAVVTGVLLGVLSLPGLSSHGAPNFDEDHLGLDGELQPYQMLLDDSPALRKGLSKEAAHMKYHDLDGRRSFYLTKQAGLIPRIYPLNTGGMPNAIYGFKHGIENPPATFNHFCNPGLDSNCYPPGMTAENAPSGKSDHSITIQVTQEHQGDHPIVTSSKDGSVMHVRFNGQGGAMESHRSGGGGCGGSCKTKRQIGKLRRLKRRLMRKTRQLRQQLRKRQAQKKVRAIKAAFQRKLAPIASGIRQLDAKVKGRSSIAMHAMMGKKKTLKAHGLFGKAQKEVLKADIPNLERKFMTQLLGSAYKLWRRRFFLSAGKKRVLKQKLDRLRHASKRHHSLKSVVNLLHALENRVKA